MNVLKTSPSGQMLTSPLWFSSPFASHKNGKNISWMAQGQKYVQGCVITLSLHFWSELLWNKKLGSAAVLYQGQKRNKMSRKGTNWGLSQIPPRVFCHFDTGRAAHLLGLFILGRAFENLSMAEPSQNGALFNLSLPSPHPFSLQT